jgi:uncharacterized protein YqhQ
MNNKNYNNTMLNPSSLNFLNKQNKNEESKSNYNGIIITVLTALYILLIFKLASILTANYDEEEQQLKTYVMIIYILSIMGLVIGYIWLKSNSKLYLFFA